MATHAKLELQGLNEMLETLQQAGKDIDAAAQRALMAGGEVLLPEMETLVPVDTENLKDHLKIDGPHQDGNISYIEVGVVGADKKTAIYGNVQEFGSPSKNIHAAYIRPSVDRKKSAVNKAQRESLKAEGLAD